MIVFWSEDLPSYKMQSWVINSKGVDWLFFYHVKNYGSDFQAILVQRSRSKPWTYKWKVFCQTPDQVFRLGVDFVLPLSQEQEQEEPLTKIYQKGEC